MLGDNRAETLDVLAAESLRRGNTLRLRARGGSMLPFLVDGDIVVVRPAAAEVRIGDVICYEPPSGGLCLHRVIGRKERGFVTRGDADSWDFDVAYDGATVYGTPGGVRIDLHWALLTEPRFVWNAGEREIWERSEAITGAGEPARGLGREDLVLYLAAHLAVHHTLAGLRRYWEVSLLLERWAGALDWDTLLARAARWRVGHALFFVLRGARARFAAPVPAGALAALRPTGARAGLLDAIVRRSDDARLLRLEHLVTLLLVDRGRDVCGALRRAVWPSAGWMRARYGIATASRPALYRAHARRLGSVVGGAAGALCAVARSSLAETRAGA